MDSNQSIAQILQIVGGIAGIGGLSLAVILMVFREVIRKNIFPQLDPRDAYKLLNRIVVLITIVALFGIGAWLLSQYFGNQRPNTNNQAVIERIDESMQIVTNATNLDTARNQIGRIEALVADESSSKKYAINALKDYFNGTFDSTGGLARNKRRLVIEALKRLTDDNIASILTDTIMLHIDLIKADLSEAILSNVNFSHSFLIENSFRNSNLKNSSFYNASIRNVDFSQANIEGVNLQGADWFNALGLTKEQLQSVQQDSIGSCPSSEDDIRQFAGFYKYLANNYVFSFDSWEQSVQEALISTWEQYTIPDGLCDFANELNSSA